MTFEVQQTRWDRIIRRVSGSVGPGSRVSETLSELFPVIDVERVPGELLVLGGTRLAVGATDLAGAAGESARTQVFNPLDSENIITVTTVVLSVSSTQTVRIAMHSAALTTGIGTETFRDSRLGTVPVPVGQMRQDSTIALTDANSLFRCEADTYNLLHDENGLAVLSPGFGYEIGLTNNATRIIVTYMWRERPAEPSELQF